MIYYDRKDDGGPKTSFYRKMDVSNPDELEAILAAAHGEKGEVGGCTVVIKKGSLF